MEKIYSVVIVGGGAGGMLSSIELASGIDAISGEDIAIIEKNDRLGKKLSATGNGLGNLSNDKIEVNNYYGNDSFIKEYFLHSNIKNIKDYLYSIGIITFSDESGKIYPLSRQANAVVDVLRGVIQSKNIKVYLQSCVQNVRKEKGVFIIECNNMIVKAKNVIISAGGKAQKQFGTDGTSYFLATNFGHKLTQITPSLVQIKTELESIKGLKGIKEKAIVYLKDNDKVLAKEKGDILFTEYGVSGSTIFSLSSKLSLAKNPSITLEFLPEISTKDLENILIHKSFIDGANKEDILTGIINKQLAKKILSRCGEKTAKNLATLIKNYNLKITGTLGFNYAQVTKGGIDCKDINPTSMQSRLVENLYLIGEYIDVDGDCGGYNLSFAFSSGILAGKSIKINNKS